MRRARWHAAVVAGFLLAGPVAMPAQAQTVDELRRRIEDLERSTREQVESLKRLMREREQAHEAERAAREEGYRVLQEQVLQQRLALARQEERVGRWLDGWEQFFDLQAGRRQTNNDPQPLGKEIRGNVYSGDAFKIRLGGSLRLHVQRNDTPVGESVSSALLPDPTIAGANVEGRENFRAFAGRTRLNLAIEGPTVLGGRTQGFFEMDFNRQLGGAGEVNAVNNNPRLRHAFGRWRFPGVLAEGDELTVTLGQTTSFADNVPDTVDFNTQLGGLGAALRRNPRVELVHRYPLAGGVKLVSSLGFERPLFDSQALGPSTDLGSGDLSGFPALSGGLGLEADRIGGDFGIGKTALYLRTTWGEFEERFTRGTRMANFGTQLNFDERRFTNQTLWGTFDLDRIGFNRTSRALTLRLKGGGLWTRGEARHLNAEFDRRLILDEDGDVAPAQSAGGFINPIFYLTDTLSIRFAGGAQYALDRDRPVVSGAGIGGAFPGAFFRTENRQAEVSIWWTPGPFTFALSFNHTATEFRRVNPGGGSETRENENNKIELISWFSF